MRLAVVEFPPLGASGPVPTQLGWRIGPRFERGIGAIDWRTVTSTSGTGVPDLSLTGWNHRQHRGDVVDELLRLTGERNAARVKERLHSLPLNSKGPVFERYMTELYRGNGWIAICKGGAKDAGADILLSHPDTPNEVQWIVQCKNHRRPLSFDETRIELLKFEEKGRILYHCDQFRLVSVRLMYFSSPCFFLVSLRIFTASELPLVLSNSGFEQARLRTKASRTFFSGSVNRNGMSSFGICNTPLPK